METVVPASAVTPRTTEELPAVSTSVNAAGQVAAKAALLRLERFRAAGAPPVEGVYVRRLNSRDLDDVIGVGGTDGPVADVTGSYLVAVDGAFLVTSPPDADGTFTPTPYVHAYILIGPGGDELAVHVTNEAIDRAGFDRVPRT